MFLGRGQLAFANRCATLLKRARTKTFLANVTIKEHFLTLLCHRRSILQPSWGVDAFEVEIEVHAGWGAEGRIAVVGLPDTAYYSVSGQGVASTALP
jgi:hypothetical protein